MTGLRQYDRDLEIPALGGDAQLRLPQDDAFLDLVREHLHLDEGPGAREARLEHARWKPGASCVGTWRIQLEDESEHLVTLKRYAGEKAAETAARDRVGADRHLELGPLRPFAYSDALGACLWTFPADRSLRGAARIMDRARSARLLDRVGATAPWSTKASLSFSTVLRYKPERRLVATFSARLHRPAPKPRMRDYVLRALLPEAASRSAQNRSALAQAGGAPFVPELLGHEPDSGIIVEQFVDGASRSHDDFSAAESIGALLAELHAIPVEAPRAPAGAALEDWRGLFAVDATLVEAGEVAPATPSGSMSWVHGDVHPDQFRTTPEGELRLLDLDGLEVADPVRDLASWVADAMIANPGCSHGSAAEGLLAGYRAAGGPALAPSCLMEHVASALQARAAASIRRLEVNAVSLAREHMRRALELWHSAQEEK